MEQGLWQWIAEKGWAAVVGLTALLYGHQRGEIRAMKDAQSRMVTREEFAKHEADEVRNREERQRAESMLLSTINALDSKIDAKLTAIFERLMGKQ